MMFQQRGDLILEPQGDPQSKTSKRQSPTRCRRSTQMCFSSSWNASLRKMRLVISCLRRPIHWTSILSISSGLRVRTMLPVHGGETETFMTQRGCWERGSYGTKALAGSWKYLPPDCKPLVRQLQSGEMVSFPQPDALWCHRVFAERSGKLQGQQVEWARRWVGIGAF